MEAGSLPTEGKDPLSSKRTPAEHDQKIGKSAQEDRLEPRHSYCTLFSSKYATAIRRKHIEQWHVSIAQSRKTWLSSQVSDSSMAVHSSFLFRIC